MYEFAYDKNRPYLPVTLWHGHEKVIITALLDTGADVSVFNRAELPLRGLTWEDGLERSVENPDGSLFRIREFMIELEVADKRFPARVQFADTSSEVRLLERADVFRRFRITIDEAKQMVRFEPRWREVILSQNLPRCTIDVRFFDFLCPRTHSQTWHKTSP